MDAIRDYPSKITTVPLIISCFCLIMKSASSFHSIDEQQSANTVPGLSFLADFENKFSKDALVLEFSKEHEQNLQRSLHPLSFFLPRFELFVGVADISTLNFWLSRSENF